MLATYEPSASTHLVANVLPHLLTFLLHFPVLLLAPLLGLADSFLALPLLLLCLFLVVAIVTAITSYGACV